MAAIKSNKKVPLTPPPQTSIVGQKVGQPPPFRPTGQGWFNTVPNFPANELIANGVLVNHGLQPTHKYYKIYLFVNSTETGWNLTGQTTQAQTSRNFYPRNMTQDDLVVTGAVANQYEYDRLVAFVQSSQHSNFSALAFTGTQDPRNYPGRTSFKLFRPQKDAALDVFKPLFYDLVITNITAGHKRFMNFPTWQLTCKVVNDHLDGNNTDYETDLNYQISIKDVYGDVKNPSPMSQGKDSSSKKAAQKRAAAKSTHNHPS